MEKVNTENAVPSVKPKKKKKGKKIILIVVILVVIAAVAAFSLTRKKASPDAGAQKASSYTEATVERRDITSTITGSGSLEAANSYSVSTILQGTILTDTFEEGDVVEKDMVLYTIDSSDVSTSLEQAEISFRQTERSYDKKLKSLEDLTVTAEKDGCITSLEVEIGDEVNTGATLAIIQEIDVMSLEVPFPSDDVASFFIGQTATVTLDSTFETLTGTITKISALDSVLTGNRIVKNVTIEVTNPGGLSTNQTASASVNGVESTTGGTFAYEEQTAVTAKVSGEVVSILVAEGDRVKKGDKIIVLESETLEDEIQSAKDSLRNAEISLQNKYDQLDNYTITSPISGTVIDKYYKAGETSESNQVMCTIYDLSYLTMTLDVDELDISEIKVGQTVSITADAVEGKTYEGVVTKVSVAGAYSNGVTTYPVTIRLDETEGLLPGMNVDATIVLESAVDVLAIPTAALQRGNTVLVTSDSPSASDGEPSKITDANGEAYISVKVTTGVADEDYAEVLSGLREGDTVAYIAASSSPNNMNAMFGGMPMGGMTGMGGQQGSGRPNSGERQNGGNR